MELLPSKGGSRDKFEPVNGKYTLVAMNYTQEKEQAKAKDKDGDGDEEDDAPLPESTLPEKVQELITDICNIQMMEGAMREIGYDASKMPLGQLSESNIKKGFECLQLISECLEEQTKTKKSLRTRLGNLSSQFYTFIPHDFGSRLFCSTT